MNGIKQVCHCGHDIDTHWKKTGRCTGLGCDDAKGEALCSAFRDAHEVITPRVLPTVNYPKINGSGRPHVDYRCSCNACLAYDRAHRWI